MTPEDPPIRASDAEREQVTELLKTGAAEGRLTLEELAQRTGAAYEATTRGELEQLKADLPAAAPARLPAERKPRRWFLGIMGGDEISGPLELSGEPTIVNIMGGTDLDLSQARIEGGQLTLTVVSIMGGSTVRVPQGVRVERSGFSLMGGDEVESGETAPPADAPVVRVRSFNLMGGSSFKHGPSRRSRRHSLHH